MPTDAALAPARPALLSNRHLALVREAGSDEVSLPTSLERRVHPSLLPRTSLTERSSRLRHPALVGVTAHPSFQSVARRRMPMTRHQRIKAVADRVAGVALLATAAVPMLAIAAAIKATSPGPALYGQVRVGRGGSPFTMWKFRSMVADAEVRRCDVEHLDVHRNGHLFKVPEDPRVTAVGRWLRRYSLDELPQLINVVRGEMSLVGPRPPLPREVVTYDGQTRRRLSVTPGLTGLWQVSGRSDLSAEESIRLDLLYVDTWSFGMDLRILLRTAHAVVRSRGAY